MKSALAAAVLAGSLSLSLAPFQCASDPDETLRQEETAPEALWGLAERFRAEHDEHARARTLRYLVDHYPSSRWAERARLALARRGTEAEPATATATGAAPATATATATGPAAAPAPATAGAH